MSKFWDQMFISKDEEEKGIISKDPPIPFQDVEKKIKLNRDLISDEYEEFCNFISSQNKMSSGNYTLLPIEELKKYIFLNAKIVTLRGGNKHSLLGTILSIPIPIKCKINNKEEIITHGCTTFLNIHKILRSHGLAMALIRELIEWGYQDKIYCDYHTTDNPIGKNSIQISSWYRVLNLPKSIGLGFTIPDFNKPHLFAKNRVKYNTKGASGFKYHKIKDSNIGCALEFYRNKTKDKKFVFYPDLDIFEKWVKSFPTYIVKTNKKIVGLFSYNSLYCRMDETLEGKLCLPLIFISELEFKKEVLRTLINLSNLQEYDCLYMYEIGDLDRYLLESVNALETVKKSWVSLYNNGIKLNPKDIYVPLI